MNTITRRDLETALTTNYYNALALTYQISDHLENGNHHYWTKQGAHLTTLDEVVRAILEDNLLTNKDLITALPRAA